MFDLTNSIVPVQRTSFEAICAEATLCKNAVRGSAQGHGSRTNKLENYKGPGKARDRQTGWYTTHLDPLPSNINCNGLMRKLSFY